jgi:hypothetical protein
MLNFGTCWISQEACFIYVSKHNKLIRIKVLFFMIDVTLLIAKHAELSIDEMYSLCVFYFKLLSVCKPRSVAVQLLHFLCYHNLYLLQFKFCYYEGHCISSGNTVTQSNQFWLMQNHLKWVSLSAQHGTSPRCGWWKWHPGMEGGIQVGGLGIGLTSHMNKLFAMKCFTEPQTWTDLCVWEENAEKYCIMRSFITYTKN